MKKRILFVLLTLVIVVSALNGCNSNDDSIIEYTPATSICYSGAETTDDLITTVNKANSGETIIEYGDDVTRFLMYENLHADGSECKEIEILIPKLKTEKYNLEGIYVFRDHYRYIYTHKDSSYFIYDSLDISKYKNDSNYKVESYSDYAGNIHDYTVQANFRDDMTDAEAYINDVFTFETQVLRECDVCKSGAAE